jgi:membrane-bound lytic murein transglycosylase D
LRLDFGRISPEQFERQRVEYHRGVQGEFFEQFEIAGTRVHVMRRGDSIWALSRREDQLPLWLLRQYNPDLDFEDLRPGARITVPLVKPHRDPSKAVEATESGSAADRSDRTVDGEA